MKERGRGYARPVQRFLHFSLGLLNSRLLPEFRGEDTEVALSKLLFQFDNTIGR